jgi:sphingosine kinase
MMTTASLLDNSVMTDAIELSDYSGNVRVSQQGMVYGFDSACNLVLTCACILGFQPSVGSEINNKAFVQIRLCCVIGVRQVNVCGVESGNGEEELLSLQIFEYKPTSGCCSSRERIKQVTTIHFSNEEQCQKWAKSISYLMEKRPCHCNNHNSGYVPASSANDNTNSSSSSSSNDKQIDRDRTYSETSTFGILNDNKTEFDNYTRIRRKYLVFVNPHSGPGNGVKNYEAVVKPMFEEAGIEITLVITQYALHAKEYVQDPNCNLSLFSCICIISGDGLIFEVVNGIAQRSDGLKLLKEVLCIAPIPSGTGNGLAKSVLFASNNEPYSAINCAFVAVKGKPHPLDLSRVTTPNETHYSFLSLGWGLISDIDILSESLRCLGEARLYAAAVYFIGAKRLYKGRLSMVLTTEVTDEAVNIDNDGIAIFKDPATLRYRKVITGDFLLVWVVQTSHAASTMHSGPGVELDDAIFTVYVVRNMSRFELLQLLIDLDTGDHVKHEKVETYKALSYSLEPNTAEDNKTGIYSLDGEVIEYGPVQGVVLPHAMRVQTI